MTVPACSTVTVILSEGETVIAAYGSSEHLSYEIEWITASTAPAPPVPRAGPPPDDLAGFVVSRSSGAGVRIRDAAPSETDGASPASADGCAPSLAPSCSSGESESSSADAAVRAESDSEGESSLTMESTRASAESASTGASESNALRALPHRTESDCSGALECTRDDL